MTPTIAVCFSGCGVRDGSEIHESTLTLWALDRAGATSLCCAPDLEQVSVIDHRTGKPMPDERRNVLTESARLARGEIHPLSRVSPERIDGLIFPGGFGVAVNLCTFGIDGPHCRVDPSVEALVAGLIEAAKPVGGICIAPALLARIYGSRGLEPRLTIGNDAATAHSLAVMGAEHVPCAVDDCVVDHSNRLVTTPAYMLGRGPAEVAPGIERLVEEVLKMAGAA